jgi:4-alpha-glucanotransferase
VTRDFRTLRCAGLLVPLFSIPSRESWGIGEVADLEWLGRWLRRAGQAFVQLLPVTAMPEGERSPYSALSAMAIDPIYISLRRVEDFAAAGGEPALDRSVRGLVEEARAARRVEYEAVRAAKEAALRAAFDRFVEREWRRGTERAGELEAFAAAERWWLDDYALFRALRARFAGRPWTEWAAPLRDREPAALAAARRTCADEVLFHTYLQWTAERQWRDARARAGVGLFGDLQFLVGADSADVWARPHEFRLDASVGTPPDAFSETGQDWGLPPYRWDVAAHGGFAWQRDRARRMAALYDGYRIDHLVGFYRTYVRPRAGEPGFQPEKPDEQRALGETLLAIFTATGRLVIAEDLGTVPDFVRESLARLGIPGYRVLRWEREWRRPGQPFRDPAGWPPRSVATTGTHDTETLAEWWETADDRDRRALLELPALSAFAAAPPPTLTPALRDAILRLVLASGSDYAILPVQDLFGWRDRINLPGSLDDENWRWRLPWPVDWLEEQPEAVERAEALRRWTEETRRLVA